MNKTLFETQNLKINYFLLLFIFYIELILDQIIAKLF